MTFCGGLLVTFDAPLLRLADTDSWTLIVIRGVLAFTAMLTFWSFLQYRRGDKTPFVNGYRRVGLSCMTALISILFVNAIHLTSVANVVFILAFNPMFAALLSWLIMRERPAVATLIAMLTSLIGVIIIVWDSFSMANAAASGGGGVLTNNLLGDLLALAACLTLALVLTLARWSGTDQSMSPAFGSLLAAACVGAFASPGTLSVESWGWLCLNGLIVIPLSSALMIMGPKYLAASVVAMFFLLETVLTPVWMWLIFGEVPTERGLLGGAIIFATLVAHSYWSLRNADAPSPGMR